jgi:signal transduction histidine kinase
VATVRAPLSRELALRWIAVAALYFGAARLGLSLAFIAEQISPVWPPTGLALALVFAWGTRIWPGIFLGALAANLWTGAPQAALGIAVGNTLEALVGVGLLRAAGFDPAFERVRDVLGLIAAALLSSSVSATIGVISLCAVGAQSWSAFGDLWWTWWIGDAGGDWIVAPLLLAGWARPRALLPAGRPDLRALEGAVLTASSALLAWWIFAFATDPGRQFPHEYMLFPLVMWAGLRFAAPVAALVTAIIASLAIAGTASGLGPLATDSTNRSLLLVQVFLWMLSGTGLLLAASIGERERLEADLRSLARRQAEDHRRKDEFLAMLGHELRNPLMPISIGVELLREKAGDPAAVASTRALIERQLRQVVRLVDDLLDVSRITRAAIELRREWVDLRDVIASGVECNRGLIESRAQQLQLDLPPGPLRADVDPLRLGQVMANLIHNAAKYTGERGEIRVTARAEAGHIVVRVSDNGAGMTPELLAHAFDLFVQGERGVRRSHGGLGVGLTLARTLVELHGGTITAASPGPGKGTEVTVRL